MNSVWYKFYDPGVLNTIELNDGSLYNILETYVKNFPNKNIYICLGKKLKAKYFLTLVSRIAESLSNQDIKKGDRVAVILPNLIHFPAIFFACIKIGAILVPLNPLLTSPEISKLLKIAKPKLLIFLDLFLDKVNSLDNEIDIQTMVQAKITDISTMPLKVIYPLSKIVKRNPKYVRKEKLLSFIQFLTTQKNQLQFEKVELQSLAILLCTGGTTGVSKLAALTNLNLVSNARQIANWVPHISHENLLLAALPLFHSFGLTICINVSLVKNFTVVLVPKFKTKNVLNLINKYRINLMPGVPIMFAAINKYLSKNKKSIPSLKECFSGGTELIPQIQDEFEKRTNAKVIEAYGLTEASPAATCNPIKGINKQGSIGIPLPSTQIKIINTDDGTELPVGEVGEIIIKGPQIMTGYWENNKESKTALKNNWLFTGDLGKMDADGFIFITGRKKEMITHNGFKIYPQEVEKVLLKLEDISEAGVCPIPDGYKGEAVKAVVVLKENSTITKENIIKHCKENLASFKIPKEIEFADSLPKSFLGKVVRRLLNEPV